MSKQGQISVFTAILLSMNVMVGTGILFSPSIMAAKAGNASFLAWPLTALIFLPAVFGVSQISKLIPETGGVYIYSTKILGRFAGFVTGMLSIVGYTLATATVVSALRIAMAQNFPTVIMFQSPVAFGIMAIASICMFNLISTQAFGKIQGPATIVKLIPIFLLIAFLPLITRRWLPIVAPDAMSLPSSLTLAIFSYFGFEYACNIGHHLPNKRDISKVIFLAFGGTALIYTLFHFGLLQLMGIKSLVAYSATSFPKFLPIPFVGVKSMVVAFTSIAILLTYFFSANGMFFSNVALFGQMNKGGFISGSKVLGRNNRFAQPWPFVILQGAVVFGFVTMVNNVKALADMSNITVFGSVLSVMIALYVIQKRRGAGPLEMISAIGGILSAGGLVSYSIWQLTQGRIGVGIIIPMLLVLLGCLALYKNQPIVEEIK